MSGFEIPLSYDDKQRLFAVKKLQGKDEMTGGEFAAELLTKQLRKMFPAVPEVDEAGNITNADRYNPQG